MSPAVRPGLVSVRPEPGIPHWGGEGPARLLRPKAPFHFDLTLGSYASFAPRDPAAVDLYTPGRFRRVLRAEGRLFLAELRPCGSVDEPEIEVALRPEPSATQAAELLRQLEWMVGAGLDLAPFCALAERLDPVLARIAAPLRGVRPPRTPEPFEALVIAITEQLTSIKTAGTLRARLVRRFGERHVLDGHEYGAFPTADALAGADPTEIRALGFITTKAVSIVTLAQAVVSGALDLSALAERPYEDLFRSLRQIKGIGPWTIAYASWRGFGRTDAIPDGDLALRAAVSCHYLNGARATDADVHRILAPFGEWKGLAAFHLIVAYAMERYGVLR